MALLTHELPTSGIAYADLGLDLTRLSVEQLSLLPLFSRLMLETGAGELDEVALSRAIGARTGGINTANMITLRSDPERKVVDGSDLVAYTFLRGKATAERVRGPRSPLRDPMLRVGGCTSCFFKPAPP